VRQIHPADFILFDASQGAQGVTPGNSAGASSSSEFSAGSGFSFGSGFSLGSASSSSSSGFSPKSGLSLFESEFSFIDRIGLFLSAPSLHLSSVNAYTELFWYANSNDDPPTSPPKDTTVPGIAVLHSQLTFTPSYSGIVDGSKLIIRFGWQEAGQLIPTPSTTFSGTPAELVAVAPPQFPSGSASVLLEDANGAGESATGFVGTDLTAMSLSNLPDNPSPLTAPVNVLFNLLSVSRGKSVTNEVLGSGDATVAAQEFVLKNSPLTYLLSGDSSAGGNYKSTLRVWVNGIEWKEIPSFYGQSSTATIFVTREDESNKTHVLFGDGVNGARLPSGTNNVVASYRFGSGADAPDAGKLTVIATPQPGLSSIHNPVAAGGGADPEPASQIRKYAPLSVLTFGRAVSGDDYQAIAALAPGVTRARAYWSFDSVQQRTVVTVYVGDDISAVNAAKVALRGDSDPNRPVVVKLAAAVPLQLSLSLAIDSNRVASDVITAVTAALSDSETGLFGSRRIGVGEVIYTSRIYQTCFSVLGVLAVHHLQVHAGFLLLFSFSNPTFSHFTGFHHFGLGTPYRLDPGEGKYFSLSTDALSVTGEVTNAG